MIKYKYYVYHKIQVGKKGEVREAGCVVAHKSRINSITSLREVVAALAESRNVQPDHIMVAGWNYMGWEFAILETLKEWMLSALEMVNKKPGGSAG